MTGELSDAGSNSGNATAGVRWRAVLGAALVSAAAFGVVFAHRAAQSPPEHRYLVVTSRVSAGSALDASHLGEVPIDLPRAVDAVRAADAQRVLGRVAAQTLEPSELLNDSDLLAEQRFVDPAEVEVAVSLDPDRTPLGQFGVGDTVTVLATDDTATRKLTSTARVTHLEADGDDTSIGASAAVRMTVALPDAETARAVVDAAVTEDLTITLTAPEAGEAP